MGIASAGEPLIKGEARVLVAQVVAAVAAISGSIASIAQLPGRWGLHLFLWIVIALLAISVLMEFLHYRSTRAKRFPPNSSQIVDYMRVWLSKGGRSAVFSRDLSWGSDRRVKLALIEKSKRGELLLFVGKDTELTKELRANGAEVYDYSGLDFSPEGRFTIVDYGKAGARIAIGAIVNGGHEIREYDSSDHELYAVANDLVRLAMAAATKL